MTACLEVGDKRSPSYYQGGQLPRMVQKSLDLESPYWLGTWITKGSPASGEPKPSGSSAQVKLLRSKGKEQQ